MGNDDLNDFYSSSDTNGVIKINDNEMNGGRGTYGWRREMHTRFLWRNLGSKVTWEDASTGRSSF